MIAGVLRDRVKILSFSSTPDALGYPTETWKQLAEVWGNLVEEKGKEILQNDRPISVRRAILYIRYRSDTSVKNRVIVRGTTWEIESVRILERSRRTDGLELVVRAND